MQSINKLMMVSVNVSDMAKSKEFYVDKLGLEITTEYRQDDNNWWTTLALPEGGATFTLSRSSYAPDSMKPNMLSVYFETSDIDATHQELVDKGVETSDVQDNLFGPGSGVKFVNFDDPDGVKVHIAQKHDARAPF